MTGMGGSSGSSNDSQKNKKRLQNLLLQSPQVPVFTSDEIRLGSHLGSGAFATVHDIRSLQTVKGSGTTRTTTTTTTTTTKEGGVGGRRTSSSPVEDEEDSRRQQEKAREVLSKQFPSSRNSGNEYYQLRTTPVDYANDPSKKPAPRMVLKRLKSNYWFGQGHLSQQAQHDILNEMEILLRLSSGITTTDEGEPQEEQGIENYEPHPNIILLHAIVADAKGSSGSKCPLPSFVLSKLHSTLSTQIDKWRNERGLGFMEMYAFRPPVTRKPKFAFSFTTSSSTTNSNTNSNPSQYNTPHHERWIKRIIILSQVVSALNFMHERKVVYRDVKPENIGLDIDQITKLFDFGLAKSVHGLPHNSNPNDVQKSTFKLTGETGTPRYMAPEVAFAPHAYYGYSVDIYSVAILCYEVLSLKLPFASISYPSITKFMEAVRNEGLRPPIDYGWPIQLQKLITSMWSSDPKLRPTALQVKQQLEAMLRGPNEQLFPCYFTTNATTATAAVKSSKQQPQQQQRLSSSI